MLSCNINVLKTNVGENLFKNDLKQMNLTDRLDSKKYYHFELSESGNEEVTTHSPELPNWSLNTECSWISYLLYKAIRIG